MFLHSAALLIVFQRITFTFGEICIDLHASSDRASDCCTIPRPFPKTGLRECDRKARQENSGALYVVPSVNYFIPLIKFRYGNEYLTTPCHPFKCTTECYYQKLNIIDVNTLLMDQVLLYLGSLETNARELYKLAFQACDDQLMKNKEHEIITKCRKFPVNMDACVQKFVIQRCPVQYWKESEFCSQLKAEQNNCQK